MAADSYLEIFLGSALSEGEALGPLALLFLFLARFMPIVALSPFFGAKIMPNPVKMMFGITMFVIFLPKLLTVTTIPIGFNPYTLLLLFKEMLVGFIIGFLISIPFIIAQNAGLIIDHQRGGAALMVNDPTIQNQSSPIGTLLNYMLIYLFWQIEAPFSFIQAIMSSYDAIAPDQFLPAVFFEKDAPFWKGQLTVLNQVMVISIQIATPALLIMLMTDLFLGIANRLAPQVQITFLGMSLKSLLGLVAVTFGWTVLMSVLTTQINYWIQTIDTLFLTLGHLIKK